MKMTKRFEKKLLKFAKSMGLDTNFDWDIGWFDFLYGLNKIGAVRFYGDNFDLKNKSNRRNIYCVTAMTRLVYYPSGNKYNRNAYPIKENPSEIWDSTKGEISCLAISEDKSKHDTMYQKDIDNSTEDKIIEFLKFCFTRLMNGKLFEKMEDKLQSFRSDFI